VTLWSRVVPQSGPYGHCAGTAPDMPGAIAVNDLPKVGGLPAIKTNRILVPTQGHGFLRGANGSS